MLARINSPRCSELGDRLPRRRTSDSQRVLLLSAYLAIVAASIGSKLSQADTTDDFNRGLLDRGLVQVAEHEALRRLDDPLLTPVERVAWSLRLARSHLRHAGLVVGEERESLARRAEKTLADLLAAQPPLPRPEAVRTEQALLGAEHAELLAWEAQYGPGGVTPQQTALAQLEAAVAQLRAAATQLDADLKIAARRTPAQLAAGEMSAGEVRQMQRDVEHRLASTLVSWIELTPEDADRSPAITEANQRLQALADGWIGDQRTWDARLLRAKLARLRGDTAAAAGQIRSALDDLPARWLADRFTAELVRGQLADGRVDTALETLLQQSRLPGGINDELRYQQVDALLAAKRIAQQRAAADVAAQLQSQAESLAAAMREGWGTAARLRIDREQADSRYGPKLARLVQDARGAYQAGQRDAAAAMFLQAADLAVATSQPAAADELDYTRGSILVSGEEYAEAVRTFDRLLVRSPQGNQSRDADLLRAYCLGRLYSAAPSDALATQYAAALLQHRQRYAGTPSAAEATAMLAAFEEARQQWESALALYLELCQSPEHGAAARQRVAALYEYVLDKARQSGAPVHTWEDRAVADLSAFVRQLPQLPEQLTEEQSDLILSLVRIVLGHRTHPYVDAERLLTPVTQAAELQRHAAESDGREPPPEWLQLAHTAAQLRIVALAGQGRLDEARAQFNTLALTEPDALLSLLQGLSALSSGIPAEHRQELAQLQLETAQQLRLQQPNFSAAEQQGLDAAVADAYLAAGNDLNAAGFFDKLLAQSPRDRTRLRTAAELHQRLGEPANFQKAKTYWQRLESLESKGSGAWLTARLHIAECAVRLGQKEEARKLIALTRLVYPELGGADLQARFAAVEQAAR